MPTAHPELPNAARRRELLTAARAVLDRNWTGSSTIPAPGIYPHQWSWDTGFIAIGRSWGDGARGGAELEHLLEAQWSNGMVPHIRFGPDTTNYFPGPDFWQARRSPAAPREIETSGITQPPNHALAALEIQRRARGAAERLAARGVIERIYPRLVAQHDYLDRRRDPGRIDLATIVHPWESGLDNSPAWDRDLEELVIPPGALPAYERRDLMHADPKDRPTDAAYDRFVYLVATYRDSDYDDASLLRSSPFLIAGPLFNAIYLWSTHALVEIARIVGADPEPHVRRAKAISAAMVRRLWDPASRLFLGLDLRTGHFEPEETIIAFTPLLDPDLPTELVDAICHDLGSSLFHPTADAHYLVPTYGVGAPGFDARRYWRGPVWLNTNWLLWRGLRQHGRAEYAAEILASSVALVEKSGFREYFDPLTGEGHGGHDFSWTAALLIDMLERPDGE